jgi:DNA-binding transcriptional LysR family regulator
MDVNALLYFNTVATTHSFQEAARLLEIPKSTLSRKIAELEASLDVQLLNRTTRQVAVTELGQRVHRHCVNIGRELERIIQLADESKQNPHGSLRITAPITFGRIVFGRWINEFQALYPDIHLDIKLSDSYENLVDENIDVAIRVGELKDSNLVSRKLCSTTFLPMCSSQYPHHRSIKSPEDLAGHNVIALKNQQLTDKAWTLYKNGKAEQFAIQPTTRINDMLTLIDMVRSGCYIGLIPQFAAQEYLRRHELVQLLPEFHGQQASFHILYQKREHLPKKIRVFSDFIRDKVKQEPGLDG